MQYFTTKHVFLSVLLWKTRFVQVSTLIWNCTNAVLQRKIRLFVRFTRKIKFCASANADFKFRKCNNPSQKTSFWVFYKREPDSCHCLLYFKLHKCNIPPQNTSFLVFWSRKTDLCKCQFWLEIAQIRHSSPKHVFLYVLQINISFVQVPTLTLNCKITVINRKTRLLECLTAETDLGKCQVWL